MMTPDKYQKPRYICPRCDSQLSSEVYATGRCQNCKQTFMPDMKPVEVKQKLGPDDPGKQTRPVVVDKNQLLSGLLYDCKQHKFIFAKKKKKKKKDDFIDEGEVPNLSDVYRSKEPFKQLTPHRKKRKRIEPTDSECSLGPEEADAACRSLCIDG